jgi:hypothetical protein
MKNDDVPLVLRVKRAREMLVVSRQKPYRRMRAGAIERKASANVAQHFSNLLLLHNVGAGQGTRARWVSP